MKFWPLLLANLGRHKRRTLLSMASVAVRMGNTATISRLAANAVQVNIGMRM